MAKIIVSDDAAKALVKSGTTQITKSVQTVSRIQDSPSQEGDSAKIALAKITWTWTKSSGENVYHASAYLVDPNTMEVDTSKTIIVYAASDYRSGASGETEFRWIASIGGVWQLIDTYKTGTIEVTKAQTVTSVIPTSQSKNVWTGSLSATVTPIGSVFYTLSDTGYTGDSQIVTDINATSGVLGVEKKYLHATFSGSPSSVVSDNQSVSITYVSSVAVGKADRVSEVSWQ